jgi:hypothetical protein
VDVNGTCVTFRKRGVEGEGIPKLMGFAVENLLSAESILLFEFIPCAVYPFGLNLTEDGVQRPLDNFLTFSLYRAFSDFYFFALLLRVLLRLGE